MREPIDHHPARRRSQLAAASAMLRGPRDGAALQQACAVILALSRDPYERMLAERLLKDRQT